MHTEYLQGKYPKVYGKGIPCGSFFPEEWLSIIEELSVKIEDYLWEHSSIEDFRVDQIKEKFGGLRYYVSILDDTIDGYIREAEDNVNELERSIKS